MRNSRPCYQDCWHTGQRRWLLTEPVWPFGRPGLYSNLIGFNSCQFNAPKGDESDEPFRLCDNLLLLLRRRRRRTPSGGADHLALSHTGRQPKLQDHGHAQGTSASASASASGRRVVVRVYSTTRTPATDMLYNTTNGRAHNSSTTCCTTNSPPTDKNLPHPNILTWHVEMLGSGIAMWQICCTTSCSIVVSLSVGGVVQQ